MSGVLLLSARDDFVFCNEQIIEFKEEERKRKGNGRKKERTNERMNEWME